MKYNTSIIHVPNFGLKDTVKMFSLELCLRGVFGYSAQDEGGCFFVEAILLG